MDASGVIESLFGVRRALVGVVHTGGLPGTPSSRHDIDQIVETAVAEARVYAAAGFHGVIIVIVSGIATGHAAEVSEVEAVARAVGVPTLVGSGITLDNVHDYGAADALIVGSSIKHGGIWSGAIDESRCTALTRAFNMTR